MPNSPATSVSAALILIIAEGGLASRWSRRTAGAGAGDRCLATVGVLSASRYSASIVHALLGYDWRLALLYGAVLSSTDAAAVFSTLRRLPLRPSAWSRSSRPNPA